EITGISPERIVRLGDEENFWSMGDTGPCGPCSEIMYDHGIDKACGPNCALGVCDCDRFLEIWNLVFMQYNRDEKGVLTPLPRPSIDTGLGLERITSILQNKSSNYDTDLFVPIINQIEDITGQKYDRGEKGFPFRVIADHSRSCTFLIADGVLPSNDGRGYVLRRILRRAIRFGRLLGVKEAFLYKTVPTVVNLMGTAYPELIEKQDFIMEVIKLEEERFMVTLNDGIKKVEEIINAEKSKDKQVISGQDAFMLYDTYGFPLDLTEDMAEEQNFTVDIAGFAEMMKEQRAKAREANAGANAFTEDILVTNLLADIPLSTFEGYDNLNSSAQVLAIMKEDSLLAKASNEDVIIVTDLTPFYPEGGGQVADLGLIKAANAEITVNDVKRISDWILHFATVKGEIKVKDTVEMLTNQKLRLDTAKNHTATHLLHKALREILGQHAEQKGSLVEPNRLRFDFTHLSALSAEELVKIEQLVNEAILSMYDIDCLTTSIDKAKDMGAIALFGEKYGDEVRLVKIDDYSLELCGGTHVGNTGEIGLFKIISEGSIGSGLRRIEAVTGQQAIDYFNALEAELEKAANLLRCPPMEVVKRIEALQKNLKDKDREIDNYKLAMSKSSSDDLLNKVVELKGVKLLIEEVASQDVNALRQSAEMLKDKLGKAVVLLAAVMDDKIAFVCFVSKDLVSLGLHAGKIVGASAKVTGGGGGGRPDMAQAGGKDVSKITDALNEARLMVENTLT
ncbi:MAG: alanine--tRNA ligase, partial [Syntrophomonadaceae bacterium]|nr:alanine--tRNA ligase [Syntrophomonadaceae bacterium]